MGVFVVGKVLGSDQCGEAKDEENVKPDEEDKFVSGSSFVNLFVVLGLFLGVLNYLGLAVNHMEIG